MRPVRTALIGLSTTAALVAGTTGLAPGATALPAGDSTPVPIATPEGQISSYVVNVRKVKDQQITSVRRAIGRAEGDVVAEWSQIGVLVVHSTNDTFRSDVVAEGDDNVASVGATRTVAVKEGTPGIATGLTDA